MKMKMFHHLSCCQTSPCRPSKFFCCRFCFSSHKTYCEILSIKILTIKWKFTIADYQELGELFIENTFWVLIQRWRFIRIPLTAEGPTLENIALATVIRNNYFHKSEGDSVIWERKKILHHWVFRYKNSWWNCVPGIRREEQNNIRKLVD